MIRMAVKNSSAIIDFQEIEVLDRTFFFFSKILIYFEKCVLNPCVINIHE